MRLTPGLYWGPQIAPGNIRDFAMLAYVFWHRPFSPADRSNYEASVVRFQSKLANHPPPGFINAASFAIGPVPWLSDQPGYEDWYLLEASWAMDPLNAFAVAGAVQPSHDSAAAQMDEGHGGIYAHVAGDAITAAESTVHWLTRPRGVKWRPALEAVRARAPRAAIWRRQMVLGPAGEFAVEVEGDNDIEPPPQWTVRKCKRLRLSRAG
jgi:hypothetical protein